MDEHRGDTAYVDVSPGEAFPEASVPLSVLTRQIEAGFGKLGFNGFLYYGLLEDLINAESKLIGPDNIQSGWEGCHYIGTIDDDALHLFFQKIDGDSHMRYQIRTAHHPFQWQPAITSDQQGFDFLTAYPISYRLFVPMYSFTGLGWHCLYILNSSLSPSELSRWLQKHELLLLNTCFYYHARLLRGYRYWFNPWLNHRMISDRALDVLALTAEGLGSKEIARKVGLSEKGVNYHLNHLRELLGAENRVQLVAIAKDMQII